MKCGAESAICGHTAVSCNDASYSCKGRSCHCAQGRTRATRAARAAIATLKGRRQGSQSMGGTIRLRGITGVTKGQFWESQDLLRIGRLESLEVLLDDASVSRYHAEVRATPAGWRIRDLGSTNGTRLNGVRLNAGQWPLRQRDLIQIGDVSVAVDELQEPNVEEAPAAGSMSIEATARFSWEEALEGLAYDSNRCPRPGEQLLALI